MKEANFRYSLFQDRMMKFYCTLPSCKRSLTSERGLYYHETRVPIHNPNKKSFEEPPISSSSSRLSNPGKKRGHDIPISYKVSLISERERYKIH